MLKDEERRRDDAFNAARAIDVCAQAARMAFISFGDDAHNEIVPWDELNECLKNQWRDVVRAVLRTRAAVIATREGTHAPLWERWRAWWVK